MSEASNREVRLLTLRNEMLNLLREELLDLLREEWRHGCDNVVVPGGMDSLRVKYAKVVPSEIFVVLRYYADLDKGKRQKALRLAGKLLSKQPLTNQEIAWINEIATPPQDGIANPISPPPIWKSARHLMAKRRAQQIYDSSYGPIKGIIAQSSAREYFLPGQTGYESAVVRKSKGGRYFKTEEEAEVNGWRRTREGDIKGNVSYDTDEKIYHVPGQIYYASTTVRYAQGDRWFKTEEEAIAAGFRRSIV